MVCEKLVFFPQETVFIAVDIALLFDPTKLKTQDMRIEFQGLSQDCQLIFKQFCKSTRKETKPDNTSYISSAQDW